MSIADDIKKLQDENINNTDLDLTRAGYTEAYTKERAEKEDVTSYDIKKRIIYDE